MKKTVFFTVTVFIVCVALLTGCQCTTDEIAATCAIDHEKMVLPIDFVSASWFGNGTSFSTRYTLKGIAAEVNNMSSDEAVYSAELYENVVLIRMKTKKDSKLHFFAVLKDSPNPDINGFQFICPTAPMGGGSILIPYHLLDYLQDIYDYNGEEVIFDTEGINIVESQRYRLTGTYAAFVDFYRESGVFDVTESQNQILLTVKEGAYMKFEIKNNTFDNEPKSKSFTVDFIENNGSTYVRYHAESTD